MEKLSEEKKIIKLEKKLNPGVASRLRGLPEEQLRLELGSLAERKEELKQEIEDDEKLQEHKQIVKEMMDPYRAQRTQLKELSEFISLLLKEKKLE